MKQKQLTLYSGLVAGLSTPSTPAQEGLGINNKIQKYEPFVMTSATDITQVGTLTKPTQRLTIGKNANGVAKTDLQEYATLQELSDLNSLVGNALNGGTRVIADATTSATLSMTDPLYITWKSASNNLTLNSPNVTDTNPRLFIVSNKSIRAGGNGSSGLITFFQTESANNVIIPPGATYMIVYSGGGFTQFFPMSQINQPTTNTTSNGGNMDGLLNTRYYSTFSPSSDNFAYGLSLSNPCGHIPYTLIIKNTHATNKMNLTIPNTTAHFSSKRLYSLSPGKVREVSVIFDPNTATYYWQVSEELSNA